MEGWQRPGVSQQRAHPYDRPWRGGVRAGMGVAQHGRGVQRGPYYSGGPRGSPNGNRGGLGSASRSAVPSVVSGRRGKAADSEPIGGSRVVTSTQGAGSYAGVVAEGRRSVAPRGVAGRGS